MLHMPSNQKKPSVLESMSLDQATSFAQQKSEKGFIREAINIYRYILKQDYTNQKALREINILTAGSPITVSEEQNPSRQKIKMLISLYKQGEYNKLLEQLIQILDQFPNSALLYSILGAGNLALRKFQPAIENFKNAIAIDPQNSENYNNLGLTLQRKGELDKAVKTYQQALILNEDFAEAHYNLGNALKDKSKVFDAIDHYKRALQSKPDYAKAHYNLGLVYKDIGYLQAAKEKFQKTIEIEPSHKQALHLLNAISEKTTNSPPNGYVESLFNSYAEKFEKSLVNELKYQAPNVLAEIIIEHSEGYLGSALDLGCGTGLMGLELRPYSQYLEGIDLSQSMLEEARKKKIYDKLTCVNITEYLSRETTNFDYFIFADVFIYIGNLNHIFRQIKLKNKKGGRLVFSTEHTIKNDFFLETSGRYSHSKHYIESLCKKFDYKLAYFAKSDLRSEKEKTISGGFYLLDF